MRFLLRPSTHAYRRLFNFASLPQCSPCLIERIVIQEKESKKIVNNTLDRGQLLNPIFTYARFRHDETKLVFKGPVSYLGDVKQKTTYYVNQLKSVQDKKNRVKYKVIWKSREVEKWKTRITQASVSLDEYIRSRSRSKVSGKLNVNEEMNFTDIGYLDAKGIYYDGMNLIYILFYSEELHGLFISAYDISDKEFYQISFLGKLYTDMDDEDMEYNAYPKEKIVSATVCLHADNRLVWYVQGDTANLWKVEHDCSDFRGKVMHYVCFKKNICQEISNASLLAINGSAYLAGLEARNNKTTIFCSENSVNNHWPCLQVSRKKPLIGFFDGNIYHIGGIVNTTDPLVEVHRISLKPNSKDMNDYQPMQRINYFKNTYVLNENQTVNADNCIYCQCGHYMYIFKHDMFSGEEYLKYALLDNKWNILRFPEGVDPEFEIHSRLVVAVGEELYLFLFNSENGELAFKILNLFKQ